jgi:phosphoribosyl 1,2-cyclic phosphodiesterase
VKVFFWGTRGSSPVIGLNEGAFRSYHTPCVELKSGDDSLIIDAGTPVGYAIRAEYAKGKREFSICMSHFHWDHILGLISIYDLYYMGIKINIYSGTENAAEFIPALFNPAYCPIDRNVIMRSFNFIHVKDKMKVGSFDVRFVEVPHTGKTHAIEVTKEQKSMVYMSDVSLQELKENPFHTAPKLLICDSFHMKQHQKLRGDWGHSSAEQAVYFAQKCNAGILALFHYDPNYKDQELQGLVEEAQGAATTVKVHATQDCDEITF